MSAALNSHGKGQVAISVDFDLVSKITGHVAALKDDEIAALSLQNAAICWMWAKTLDAASEPGKVAKVKERILTWLAGPRTRIPVTEGRRHQPLLRDLLETLKRDGIFALKRDEIDLLCAAGELLKTADDSSDLERVHSLLERDFATLQDYRGSLPPLPGQPNLNGRLNIVTEARIRSAGVTASRFLAGIELPARGPVLECHEDTLVLGDIPDSCTVIVHEGSCWIEGYLLGRVLAKANCEVRENIAGVAIVLGGSIRARNIINNAHVVAKAGDILCRNAQSPRLLFAANRILVAETSVLGKHVARDIEICGEAQDGEFHITDQLKAECFRHSGAGRLSIVMRKELRSEDYGEVTSAQINRLVSDAYRLRQSAQNLRTVAALNESEAEQQAEAALRYLLSTPESEKTAEHVGQLQRRLDTVRRLMVNLEAVLAKAQQETSSRARRGPVARTEAESDDATAALSPPGYELDKDFAEQDKLARQYRVALVSKTASSTQTDRMIGEIKGKLALLVREKEAIEKEIKALGKSASSPQYEHLLEARKGATKADVFLDVLPGIYRNPPPSLVARLESPLIQRALRTVASCLKHAKQCRERAEENESGFKTASAKLGEEFHERLANEPAKTLGHARVEGRFEPGVRIFMGLDEFEAETPRPGGMLTTAGASDAPRVICYPQGGSFRTEGPDGLQVLAPHCARKKTHDTNLRLTVGER